MSKKKQDDEINTPLVLAKIVGIVVMVVHTQKSIVKIYAASKKK